MQLSAYEGVNSPRLTFLRENRTLTIVSLVITSLVSGFLWSFQLNYSWSTLIIPSLFSILYLFPLPPYNKRLRDIPFFKIWAIAFIWASVTLLFPLIGSEIEACNFLPYGIERFLFFLMITLPFDIRDRREDELIGISTIVTRFSRPVLIRFGYILFLIHAALIWMASFELFNVIAWQLTSIIAILLLIKSNEDRPIYFFSFIIDGLIALRLILILLVQNIG